MSNFVSGLLISVSTLLVFTSNLLSSGYISNNNGKVNQEVLTGIHRNYNNGFTYAYYSLNIMKEQETLKQKIKQQEEIKIIEQKQIEEEKKLEIEKAVQKEAAAAAEKLRLELVSKEQKIKQQEEEIKIIEQKQIEEEKLNQNKTVPTTQTTSQIDYETFINQMCTKYNCNAKKLVDVMYCESGGRANAKGYGQVYGIMQFMPSTFNANAAKMKLSNAEFANPYHQLEVAAFMFSIGQSGQWSCKG